MDFGFATLPAITVCCYLIGEIVKLTPLDTRYIPVICGAAGLVLSVTASLLIPAYASTDLLEAAAIGIVSGLAATGANQVAKQAKK